jgi:hypothetical protein
MDADRKDEAPAEIAGASDLSLTDYPSSRGNCANLHRGLARRHNRPTPHRDFLDRRRDLPTPRHYGSVRNAAEPIRLATGSNDRGRGATPSRSRPTLG